MLHERRILEGKGILFYILRVEPSAFTDDIHFSTISSILNGSAAIIWSDVVRPFMKVNDTTATRISKGLAAYQSFAESLVRWPKLFSLVRRSQLRRKL